MKNNIRFLICSLVITQTILPSFTVQSTSRNTILAGSFVWVQPRSWENIVKEEEKKYSKSFEIPVFMQQATISINNISGFSVSRDIQRIAFQRFIDALQGKKFDSFENSRVKSVTILINDRNDSSRSPLSVAILSQDEKILTADI